MKDYKEDQRKTKEALKPKLVKTYSPFRREIKRKREIDRSYTATGKQTTFKDISGGIHVKKAKHIVNDYRYQR